MTGVFSLFVPGDSLFHRLGVGWKYVLLLALTVPGLAVRSPWLSMGLLGAALMVLAACGTGIRFAWSLPAGLWLLVAVLAGYQFLIGQWPTGIEIAANLLTAVYASRMLTMTTPGGVLIDALVGMLAPLRRVGLDPERVGLAIAIMVRSVPVLLDSFDQARQAARARGRERNVFGLVTPVVVRAVGFAQATGAALAARGLGEDNPRMDR